MRRQRIDPRRDPGITRVRQLSSAVPPQPASRSASSSFAVVATAPMSALLLASELSKPRASRTAISSTRRTTRHLRARLRHRRPRWSSRASGADHRAGSPPLPRRWRRPSARSRQRTPASGSRERDALGVGLGTGVGSHQTLLVPYLRLATSRLRAAGDSMAAGAVTASAFTATPPVSASHLATMTST